MPETFLCEYTISGRCPRDPECVIRCAYHNTTDLTTPEQKLTAARRLVEQVNDVEKRDPELNWRPWKIIRSGDLRG
jgi:hypothetical protein